MGQGKVIVCAVGRYAEDNSIRGRKAFKQGWSPNRVEGTYTWKMAVVIRNYIRDYPVIH